MNDPTIEVDTVRIDEVSELSDTLLLGVQRLLPHLAPSAPPLTRERLQEIVSSEACRLLVARSEAGEVVGMLILATYPIATGRRFWIEDVVVSPAARGQGIGEALVRRGMELAGADGGEAVDLTSRPSREAANRLYVRLGFRLRETNVYRLELEG